MEPSRRDFLSTATAAAAAVGLASHAEAQWQPSQRYPDPPIKILDPSFTKYRLNSGQGRADRHRLSAGAKARSGSATGATCCGATSPTTGS